MQHILKGTGVKFEPVSIHKPAGSGGMLLWVDVMARNALEIVQMSCFCESFIVWNGYVHRESQRLSGKIEKRWTKLPRSWGVGGVTFIQLQKMTSQHVPTGMASLSALKKNELLS